MSSTPSAGPCGELGCSSLHVVYRLGEGVRPSVVLPHYLSLPSKRNINIWRYLNAQRFLLYLLNMQYLLFNTNDPKLIHIPPPTTRPSCRRDDIMAVHRKVTAGVWAEVGDLPSEMDRLYNSVKSQRHLKKTWSARQHDQSAFQRQREILAFYMPLPGENCTSRPCQPWFSRIPGGGSTCRYCK